MAALDCSHPNHEVEKRLERILSLHHKKMDFRLDKGPYRDLLARLGNPHQNTPPIIHIAGTNGKGSTLAFLKSIFTHAGYSVHAYSSPHLLTFNERIILSNAPITDDHLIQLLDHIHDVNNDAPLTFFEYTTAMAFYAFATSPADICLLETGLGGRLDCTNVINSPIATAITAIGYDHMDWLGADIKTIAAEKAGIMKPGVPCFIAPQPHDVMDVFETHAAAIKCPLHPVARHPDLPPLGLMGDHQKDNASLATTIASTFYPKINLDVGLKNAIWPARMEKISDTPEIWFDCGHNTDGAQAIATQLRHWTSETPNRPIHLILGLAADKDPNDFLAPLWPYLDRVTCVDLPNARNPQTAYDLAAQIKNAPCPVDIHAHVKDAVQGQTTQTTNARTLVTGSLYLYGQMQILV